MRVRCYKITFLKDGSLEPLEVIIPSYNQESARRNIELHNHRVVSIKFLGWQSFDISCSGLHLKRLRTAFNAI